MTAPSAAARDIEMRTDGAQMEWTRWKRVTGTLCAGIRTSVAELRLIVGRLDIDSAHERELLRVIEMISANVTELDGEDWLKSPLAMKEKRELEAQVNRG